MEPPERVRRRAARDGAKALGKVEKVSSKLKAASDDADLDMRRLLRALQSVRDGDFSVRLPSDKTGIIGKLADTFNEIVVSNQRMALEMERAGQIIGKQGRTRHRVSVDRRAGSWGAMEGSINTLIEDLLWPTTEVTRTMTAVAKGDLSQTMRLEVEGRPLQGDFLRSASIVNTMIDQMSAFTSEVTRVARELQSEVAERLRIELALKEVDRHKDEFLATLAHELRNPLAPIRNAVDIMTRLPLDNPKLLWARDAIGRQVGHLTKLVDDLLDVSRITRGRINLSKEPLAIGPLLMRAIETVQPTIAARGHELRVECPDERLMIDADQTRLIQVLGNVLSNAAKYTPPGGRIEIHARAKAGGASPQRLEIRVRDNGIGIAPEFLPRLFNLFSQIDSGDRRSQNGLGIGLALVRRLVEMHGGDVSVHSAGVGQGSEFTLRLPLLENAVEAAPVAVNTSLEHSGPRRRILLADDNQDALDGLAALLENAGHEVCKASDGADAVERAAEWRPDLAVLDIGMPRLSGYEVAQRIRAEEWGRDLVLVALSGWGQTEDLLRSRESGFDLHLVKPVSFDSLTELVAGLPARS